MQRLTTIGKLDLERKPFISPVSDFWPRIFLTRAIRTEPILYTPRGKFLKIQHFSFCNYLIIKCVSGYDSYVTWITLMSLFICPFVYYYSRPWLIIMTDFQLAAISMESPPSSRNSDSSPESEEDKDEEIEVIECWVTWLISMTHHWIMTHVTWRWQRSPSQTVFITWIIFIYY